MAMFCAVSFGGCGGSSSSLSGSYDSRDIIVPDTPAPVHTPTDSPDSPAPAPTPTDSPDSPAPAPTPTASPDTPAPHDNNALISGTWRVTSGTYTLYDEYSLQDTAPETFSLTVRENDNGDTYSVTLSEVVSLDFGIEYDGEKYPEPFSAEGSDYVTREDGNGYISEEYGYSLPNGQPVHAVGDEAREIIVVDSDTLQYRESYVNVTATGWDTRMELTLKRVN